MIPDGLEATLVLVRHGESVFIAEDRFQGQADSPLSALGRRQAASWSPGSPDRIGPPPCRCRATAAGSRPFAAPPDGRDRGRHRVGARGRHRAALRGGAWTRGACRGRARVSGRACCDSTSRRGTRTISRGWRRDPTLVQAPGGERLVEVQARVALPWSRCCRRSPCLRPVVGHDRRTTPPRCRAIRVRPRPRRRGRSSSATTARSRCSC